MRISQCLAMVLSLLVAQGSLCFSIPSALATENETSPALELQNGFNRIAEKVGPAVVSISTEQVEKVREYYRGNPHYRPDREQFFEEFFRQYEEGAPTREQKRFGLGSGVVIDESGLILTNEHVIANADKIMVTFSDGREVEGVVQGKDKRSDLAVIKVDVEGLTAAQLGNSDLVRTGHWAIALGNPFGIVGSGTENVGPEPTLTVGVVSATNRSLPRTPHMNRDFTGLIQTDAAINPGNSGGPLLNIKGEVIGINVAIFSSSRGYEGIGFAIPTNKVQRLLENLKEGRTVSYGWLGVQVQPMTQNLADHFKVEPHQGVLVYTVLPKGPADEAKMRSGDVLMRYNDTPIRSVNDLIQAVSFTQPGEGVTVLVLRDGKEKKLTVRIGDSESQMPEAEELNSPKVSESWRGMHVAGISPVAIEKFNLPFDTSGVIVIKVDADSPAGEAGLRAGDRIVEINEQSVKSFDDYEKRVRGVKGDVLVKTTRGYLVIQSEK